MSTSQQSYHTQMPNELMEVLMSKAVNSSMKAVLVCIARKTYGFHKETDQISLTQFEKHTTLTRPTIVAALSKLQRANFVLLLSKGRSRISSNEWKLDLSNWEEKLVKLNELVKNDTSQLVKSSLHTKEKQNKFNNYLPTSSSFKETTYEEIPDLGTVTQPKGKPQPEMVFRNQLKKLRIKLDSLFDKKSDEELENLEVTRNTRDAIEGIIYYINKYKLYCGEDHPFYKTSQLQDCFMGFLDGIWNIERSGLEIPLQVAVQKVIDRWFETTPTEANNLRLSHFAGQGSWIFCNALSSVMRDYGLGWWRKEDNADS